MRPIGTIWDDYLFANPLTDEEMKALLKHVRYAVDALRLLSDKRYRLVLSDLQQEQMKLEGYVDARRDRKR